MAIYQKKSSKYFKWKCLNHNREATYICIKETSIIVVCDPKLGGILLPCSCEINYEH